MSEAIMWIITAAETVAVGLVAFYFQRAQKRRDKAAEKHTLARRQETLLSLEMQMANAKLSSAVAMAWKRGTPNGEVEEGIEAYEDAKKKYLDFLNEQAAEHLID